ncbi:MAG: flippase-like domain-containing protein [Saprospiraceae bacterium]|nr:flippase-like domain-containing protein [Saprospiraceae bacterium]
MKSKNWVYLKWVISALFLIFFAYYIRNTSFAEMSAALSEHYISVIGLIFISLSSYLLATFAWRILDYTKELQNISFFNLFMIRQSGESLSSINPTGVIGGDMYKLYHLKKFGVDTIKILPSIFVFRIMSIISFILYLLTFSTALLMTVINNKFWSYSLFILLLAICFYTFLFLANKKLLLHTFFKKFSFISEERSLKIKEFNEAIVNQFNNHLLISIAGLMLLYAHWVVGGMEVYYLMHFVFGYDFSLVNGFTADFGIMLSKTMGMFVPGQLGIEEFGNKYMLAILGVTSGTLWLTFSVLRRSRQLFWLLCTFLYVTFANATVKKAAKKIFNASSLLWLIPYFNSSR